ncbi:MAG: hypothetical protein AAF447_02750 [Myxococcota bacterium]
MPRLPHALALCLALGACGGAARYAITGTARAELAQGTIQLEAAEGDLRLLTLIVDQLEGPEDHGEGLGHYVVWLAPLPEDEEQAPSFTRLGALEYDAEGKSGRFSDTTRLRTFVLRITAEASADAAAPSDLVVAERIVRPAASRGARDDGSRPPAISPVGAPPRGPVGGLR